MARYTFREIKPLKFKEVVPDTAPDEPQKFPNLTDLFTAPAAPPPEPEIPFGAQALQRAGRVDELRAAEPPPAPRPGMIQAPAPIPGLPDADVRHKGPGFLGTLQRPDGRHSTELSFITDWGEGDTEIPLLTPNQSQEQVDYLLSFEGAPQDVDPAVVDNAVAHARTRMSAGKSPFAGPEDQPPLVTTEDTPPDDPEIVADMAERLPDISGLAPDAITMAKEIPYLVSVGASGALRWLAPIMGQLWYVRGEPIGAKAWQDMFDEAVDFWDKRRDPNRLFVPNYTIEPRPGSLMPQLVRLPNKPVADIVGETVHLGGAVAGPVRLAIGAGRLVTAPLADPRISSMFTLTYARPFFRDVLTGMIGGALLGEGELEQSLENMALFGIFEAAGYLTKIPQAIKDSTAWRKATIPERGLMLQSLEDTITRAQTGYDIEGRPDPYWQARIKGGERPGVPGKKGFPQRGPLTEGQILKIWNSKDWRDAANEGKGRDQGVASDIVETDQPTGKFKEVEPDFVMAEPEPTPIPKEGERPTEVEQPTEPILSKDVTPFKTERGAVANIPKAQKAHPGIKDWTVVPVGDGFGLMPRHQVAWQQTLEEFTERSYLQGRRFEDIPDEEFEQIARGEPAAREFATVPFDSADHKAAMRALIDDRIEAMREMGGIIRKAHPTEKRKDGTPRIQTTTSKHYREIAKAIKAGLPVPEEVRADYPALRGEVAVPGEEPPDIQIPERAEIVPGMVVDTPFGLGEVVGVSPTVATVEMADGEIRPIPREDISTPPAREGAEIAAEEPEVEIEPQAAPEEEAPEEPEAAPVEIEPTTLAEQVEGFARGKIKEAFPNITDFEVNMFLAKGDSETIIRSYLERVTYTGDIEEAVDKGLRDITDIMDVQVPEFEKREGLGLRPEAEEELVQVEPELVGTDRDGKTVRIGDTVALPDRFPGKQLQVVRQHPKFPDKVKVRLIGQKREYVAKATDVVKVKLLAQMPAKAKTSKIKTLIGWFRKNPIWDESVGNESFTRKESGVVGLLSKKRGTSWDILEIKAKEAFILTEGQTWEDLYEMLIQEIGRVKEGLPPTPIESLGDAEKEFQRRAEVDEQAWIDEIATKIKVESVGNLDLKIGDRVNLVRPEGDAEWFEVTEITKDHNIILSDGDQFEYDPFEQIEIVGGEDFGVDRVEDRPDTRKRVTLKVKKGDQIPSLNRYENKLIGILADAPSLDHAIIKVPLKEAKLLDRELWLSHEAQLRHGMRSQYDKIGWAITLVQGDATGNRHYEIERPYGAISFNQSNNTFAIWPRYEDLISESRVVKRKPKLDEERIIRTSLMRDVMNQQPARSIPNELLQNSLDAMPFNRPWDQQAIVWKVDGHIIDGEPVTQLTFTDNGRGMTPEDIAFSYLKIGAKGKKGELSKGGFGKANAALLYYPNKIKITTTAWAVENPEFDVDSPERWSEGQNEQGIVHPDAVKIRSDIEATQDEMFRAIAELSGELDVEQTERGEVDIDEPTGTTYQALYSEQTEYGSLKLGHDELLKGFREYIQQLRHKAVVIEQGISGDPDAVVHTKDFDDFTSDDLLVPRKDTTANKSKVSIFLVKSGSYGAPKFHNGYVIAQRFYNKGLPLQIRTDDISGIKRLPFEPDFKIFVNFTRTPEVDEDEYPFTHNRTQVTYETGKDIAEEVNKVLQKMIDKHFKGQVKDFNRMLKQSPTIEGVLVTIPYKDPAEVKAVKTLIKKHRPLFRDIAKVFNLFNQLMEEAGQVPVRIVMTTHPGLHGYRSNPDRGVEEMYALNPWTVNEAYLLKPEYKAAIDAGEDPLVLQAENMAATFMHERAHKDYPDHDADWGGRFTELFVLLGSFRYALLGRASYDVFKKHEKGIRQLTESFKGYGGGGLLISPESALNLHREYDSARIKGSSPENKVGGTFAANRIQFDLFGEHQKLDSQEELPSSPEDFLKRSFPDATPGQIEAMLEEPKLREQVARGNISTELADQVAKKYNLARSLTQREMFPSEAKGQGDLFDLSRKNLGDDVDDYAEGLGPEGGALVFKGEARKPEGEAFESSDEDVQRRVEEARGQKKKAGYLAFKEYMESLKNRAFRTYEHLPKTREFAELQNALLRLQKARGIASRKTGQKLKEITLDLNKTDEIDFAWKVILDDLMEEVGLQRERGTTEDEIGLPYGYTPETLAKDYADLNKHIQGNPEIEAALKKRGELWDVIRKDYTRAMKVIGFDVSKFLTREFYFRHQVLNYVNVMGLFGSGERLRTPTYRSHLRPRTGSSLDINADYLQAENEVISQMLYDIEIARVIETVDRHYNIQDDLKGLALHSNDTKMYEFFNALAQTLETPEGKEPLTGEDLYKQILNKKMAIGFDKLGKHAAMQELPTGKNHEWEWLTIELGDNWLENKAIKKELGKDWTQGDRVSLPGRAADALIKYAAWVLKNHGGEPGSGAAATIFKGMNEKRKTIQETLGDEYLEWRDLIPPGYTTWQPWEGTTFFMAHSVPETIAKQLLEAELEEIGIKADDLRKGLMRGGRRREYVVKQEIADTLNELSRPKRRSTLGRGHAWVIKRWKIWQLVSPRRFSKYNFRNLTGDADATFVGSPAIFKGSKFAFNELWDVFVNDLDPAKVGDGEVAHWLDRGGWGATLQAQEMGEFDLTKPFIRRHEKTGIMGIPQKAWDAYWQTARISTDFREALLRYAAYREALAVMKASPDGLPKDYWASIPEEIRGLSDIRDRAYFMSNDLLGAYDRVSVMGQELRERYFPFWSWKAVNFVRYVRLARNAANSGELTKKIGYKAAGTAARSPFIAMRIGKFLLKAFALYALTMTINGLLFPREEDDLPEEIKGRPHLVFGRDKNGNVQYFPRIGALADNLEWFGLDATPYYINQWTRGRMTLEEIVADMAKSPANVIVQGSIPFIKLFGETLTRRALFPDAFEQRTVRDRGLHLARSFGLENEYMALAGKPSRPYIESAKGVLIYTIDPFQAAYRDTLDQKTRFMKRIGKHSTGFYLSDRGQSLYNARLAMRYDDYEATINYMAEYLNHGGTLRGIKQSLEGMHPLSELNANEEAAFVLSLDAEGLAKFVRALRFWEELVTAPAPEEKRRLRLLK